MWRDDNTWFSVFLVAILIVIGLWVAALMGIPRKQIVYRCDLAEISPDFPIEVRERCRELRMNK